MVRILANGEIVQDDDPRAQQAVGMCAFATLMSSFKARRAAGSSRQNVPSARANDDEIEQRHNARRGGANMGRANEVGKSR